MRLIGPSIDAECGCQAVSPRSVLDTTTNSNSTDDGIPRGAFTGAVERMKNGGGELVVSIEQSNRRTQDEAFVPPKCTVDPLAPKLSTLGRLSASSGQEIDIRVKNGKSGWFWGRYSRNEIAISTDLKVRVPSRRAGSEATSPTEIRSEALARLTAATPQSSKVTSSRGWGGIRKTSQNALPSPPSPSLQAIEQRVECREAIADEGRARYPSPFKSLASIPRNVTVKPAMLETQALNRPASPAPTSSPQENLGRSPTLGRRSAGGDWTGGRMRKASVGDPKLGGVISSSEPGAQMSQQGGRSVEAHKSGGAIIGVQEESSQEKSSQVVNEYIVDTPEQSHSLSVLSREKEEVDLQDVSSAPSSFRSPSTKGSRDQNEDILDPVQTSSLSLSQSTYGNQNEYTATSSYPEVSSDNFPILVSLLEARTLVAKRKAAATIRDMTRMSPSLREGLGNAGVVPPLVALMTGVDAELLEHVALAACNLAIGNKMNKTRMVACGSIPKLVNLLQDPSMAVREASTAALLTLAAEDEHKAAFGKAGAIPLLTGVLCQGSPQGQQDAAHTLYNLLGCDRNRDLVLNAKPVPGLLGVILSSPKTRGAERAVAVIYTLTAVEEGRVALTEAPNAVLALVNQIQWGSERGKEVATAALLTACLHSRRCRHMAVELGAVAVLLGFASATNSRTAENIRSLLKCLERAGSAPVVMVSNPASPGPAPPFSVEAESGSGFLFPHSFSGPSRVGIVEGRLEFNSSNKLVRDMVKESMEGAMKSIRIRANLPPN